MNADILVLMSLGAFVSEDRQTTWLREVRGPVLVVVAVATLVVATGSDAWTVVSLGVVGLVVGELGVELASRDYQIGDDPPPAVIVGGAGCSSC